MRTWLVHVLGEADLGISSQQRNRDGVDPDEARRAMDARLQALSGAVERADRETLVRLLVDGAWDDGGPEGEASPPLPAVLRAVTGRPAADGPTWGDPEINLLLVATAQRTPGRLDTAAMSAVLVDALTRDPALLGVPVAQVQACIVEQFGEPGVRAALAGPLSRGRRGDRGIVGWATGSSTLALGAMTAIVEARLPLVLIDLLDGGGEPRLVDPLAGPAIDPVVALLIRWRMFPQLSRFAAAPDVPVYLDEQQAEVVDRLASRWEAGYRADGVDALRGLLADAVVRGDGTAGFAVRRYIEARYDELLRAEPDAVNLLEWAARLTPGEIVTLGARLRRVREHVDALPGGRGRASTAWLLGNTVPLLNDLGRLSSHALTPVSRHVAELVAGELAPHGRPADADQLTAVGLPAAPTTAGTTVFVAWTVGPRRAPGRMPIGERFLREAAGPAVRAHLGISADQEKILDVEALLVATPDSAAEARTQKLELHRRDLSTVLGRVQGRVLEVPTGLDPEATQSFLHSAVAEQLPGDAAAIVVVPSGLKSIALPLLTAARRVGAERGLPVFLREMSETSPGVETGAHLWPGLVGGDLPLLLAAREAAEASEWDVAGRLLAATSVAGSLGARCRELADVVACRLPAGPGGWPEPMRTLPDARSWTCGLMSERLRLVRARLAASEPGSGPAHAVRIRHLMLAACAVEVSVGALVEAGASPDRAQKEFRAHLRGLVAGAGPTSDAARVLLLLNEARDALPITHGEYADPDAAVRDAVSRLAGPGGTGYLTRLGGVDGVPSLIGASVRAAEDLFGPSPVGVGKLVEVYDEWLASISLEIAGRQALSARSR